MTPNEDEELERRRRHGDWLWFVLAVIIFGIVSKGGF